MNVTKTAIPEVLIIEPKVFADERGFFFESFNQAKFERAIGRKVKFVQDNHSRSVKNVLRGLHFQEQRPQGKLIRVVSGEIYDVVVDIRRESSTFGKWVSEVISDSNKKQIWLPEGFAHGFLVLSESADLLYKTTDYYFPEFEKCISWDDVDLAVNWPSTGDLIISAKDQLGQAFEELFGTL